MSPSPDREAIAAALAALGVPEGALWSGFERVDLVKVESGTTIAREGEPCDAMFLLVDGSLELVHDETAITLHHAPNLVGETQIFSGGPHAATVRAATACRLARLSAGDFAALAQGDVALVASIATLAARRLRERRLASYLRSALNLSDALVAQLVASTTWRTLERDDVLLREGEAGDGVFLLFDGRLRVTDREGRVLGDRPPGTLIGEIQLFSGGIRTATVVATRRSTVAQLGGEVLRDAMRGSAELTFKLAAGAVQRISRPTAGTRDDWASVNVAVISADPSLSVDELVDGLQRSLSAMGKVAPVTRERIRGVFGRTEPCGLPTDDPRGARVRAWRAELEASHDFLLEGADRADAPWAAQCIDVADIVITFARPQTSPLAPREAAVGPSEEATAAQPNRSHAVRWLVTLHDEDDGRMTCAPSRGEAVSRYFHVRRGSERDFARLARAIAARENGLVLSGGGARSFAHLGMIQALEERAIPIDVLGGTSAGACVSALYCFGLRGATLEATLKGVLGGPVDYTLPIYSVARGRAMRRRMSAVLGDVRFEELPLPMFCVATDISEFGLALIDRGPVANAVLASASLPGIFPPVKHEGHWMVDGGLVNALPVDLMRAVVGPKGKVLASDVTGGSEPDAPQKTWLRRMLGGPLISDVLAHSVAAAGAHQLSAILARGRPDLRVRPDTTNASPLDFTDPRPLRERGLAAARVELESMLAAHTLEPALATKKGRLST